jgi:UDP-N-acetylmuramate: L-alanyl-gamma-D-glutamyl-meso-diaminopimelate ligase
VADVAWFFKAPGLGWDLSAALAPLGARAHIEATVDALVQGIAGDARPGDQVLVMSNGGFGGLHEKLLTELRARASGAAQGLP